ncbi:MAG: hypothetical protein ABI429_00795 [Jatrophihabitantaceae bacterium]
MSQNTTPPFEHLADETGAVDQHGDAATSKFALILGRLPNLLSSKPVIVFGILLFFYLFVFAGLATLLGHPAAVSTNIQLILGNYTNVSSSVGAGIAAGASLTLVKKQRHAHRLAEAAHIAALEARAFAQETHSLLHLINPEDAARLGHTAGTLSEESRRAIASHRGLDGR